MSAITNRHIIGLPGMPISGKGSTFSVLALTGLFSWHKCPWQVYQDSAKTTPAVIGDLAGAVVDLSGNGRDMLQANNALRSTLQARFATPPAIEPYNAALSWNASTTYMRSADLVLPNGCTIYMSLRWGTNSGTRCDFDGGRLVGNRMTIGYIAGTGFFMNAGTQLTGTLIAPTAPSNLILTAQFNGANSIMRVNGVEILNGNAGSNNGNALTWGCRYDLTQFQSGATGEMIITAHVDNLSTMQAVERYLRSQSGTTA